MLIIIAITIMRVIARSYEDNNGVKKDHDDNTDNSSAGIWNINGSSNKLHTDFNDSNILRKLRNGSTVQ